MGPTATVQRRRNLKGKEPKTKERRLESADYAWRDYNCQHK